MKKPKRFKQMLFVMAAFLAVTVLPVQSGCFVLTAEAHSGRTDASGGHRDNKNKSGLGSYHYHHGYPAHLHPDGLCPYDSAADDLDQDFSQPDLFIPAVAAPVSPAPDAGLYDEQNAVIAENGTDGSANVQASAGYESVIFDPAFYAAAYADLAPIQGDAAALYAHFAAVGMQEGRQGAATFNVSVYIQNNPDLVSLFGGDLKSYYEHYLNNGQYEGRVAY